MPSQYIRFLRKQIDLIKSIYIDFPYDPLGGYTRKNLLNASAYILLAHAEIEAYIEERTQDLIRRAEAKWTSHGKSSRTLLANCVFRDDKRGPPEKHSQKNELGDVVVQALNSASARVSRNNGIKEHNFIRLLHTVGYEVHTVDPLLVAELNTIGAIRGDHAHLGSRHHFARRFDPFDILNKIGNVLTLLDDFDKDISAYRKREFGH